MITEKKKAYNAAWRLANREKVNATNAAWQAANPEKVRAGQAAYRAANKEKIKAHKAAYYAANTDKRKAWEAANAEKRRAQRAVWRAANREKIKVYDSARSKARYAANREEIRSIGRVRKYGLSSEAFQLMILMQKNSCAICKKPFSKESFSKETNIDHDHKTGEVRGLLCGFCNRGLGNFKDSIALLKSAEEYLQG